MKNDVVFGLYDERNMTTQEWLEFQRELAEAKEWHDSLKQYSVFCKGVEVNDTYLTEPEARKLATTWREIRDNPYDVRIKNMASVINNKYPFNEGEDYWIIEGGVVVHSYWDEVSEEMYDENPNTKHFSSREEAKEFLTKNK